MESSFPGTEPASSASEGGFLTTGLPRRSLRYCFLFTFLFSVAFPITEGMPVDCSVRDQTICRWVKAKPTFPPSSIPRWRPPPQGLRPHLPLGLPPSGSFAFPPPQWLPRVHQARVCPCTFLLWSQCRAPGDQPVSPFILTEVRLSDCLQWFQNYQREMKIQPDSTVPFPLSGHSGSAGPVPPEGLWLHFPQLPLPPTAMPNVAFGNTHLLLLPCSFAIRNLSSCPPLSLLFLGGTSFWLSAPIFLISSSSNCFSQDHPL